MAPRNLRAMEVSLPARLGDAEGIVVVRMYAELQSGSVEHGDIVIAPPDPCLTLTVPLNAGLPSQPLRVTVNAKLLAAAVEALRALEE